MALFESYERRIDQINAVLNSYGISSIEEAEKITKDAGLDVYNMVKGIQPICFENACWAYIVGAAIAIKKGARKASEAAAAIGEGLQAFCIPGSVADQRKVGLGHGNLGKMLLEEDTECFAFLAGHESFAAAEGAIGIAEKANKVRQKPLRVILNGLGKDAAKIISRINGFTFVETEMDYATGEVKEIERIAYSDGLRSKVNCYGANDVTEGVAIMWKENVDISITGNSTNPTRFQHPVAGTYKKERLEEVLYNLVESITIGANLLKSFMPNTTESILKQLYPDNPAEGERDFDDLDKFGLRKSGEKVTDKPEILFARLDINVVMEEVEKLQEAQRKANGATEYPVVEKKPEITYDDFSKIQIQVGEVLKCEPVKKAKKLLCSQIRVGDDVRQIVSGISQYYKPEEMVGKKVAVVANLAPRKICGVESQGMILAAMDDKDNLSVMTVDKDIIAGSEIG